MNDINFEKQYGKRFGDVAIDMGFINREQLQEALLKQSADEASHKPRKMIGEILIAKGWLTLDQLPLVLEEMLKMRRKH